MKLLKSSFWLNSVFYTLLQRFSLFFFGAVSYMLLVRAFGEDESSMAVWALYLTILTLFETVKQGMLRNPTIKFLGMTEYADRKREVQSSALALNTFFSIVIIILIIFFSQFLSRLLKSPDLTPLLWWSILIVILFIPFNHYEVLLQAHYQFKKIFIAYLVRQGIFFGGIVILFFFFPRLFTPLHLVWLQTVSLVAGTIVLFFATSPYRLRGYHHDFGIMSKMFHFGKYIFGTNMFANIARTVDHFITASLLSPHTGQKYVAYYNISGRISNMLDVPALATADVLFPKNVETLETDGVGKVKYYFERILGTVLAVLLPVTLFIVLFPNFVVLVIAGKQYYYTDAALILQISIIGNLVRPLGYHFGSTLDALGKPRINFLTTTFLMTVSLVVTYFGLLYFGGRGAAYASLVFNIVSLVVMSAVMKKYIQLEPLNVLQYMIACYKDVFALLNKLRKTKTEH